MANIWGAAIHVNNCKPEGLAKDDTPVRWTDGDTTDISTTGRLVWEQGGSPLRTIWLPEGHSFYGKPGADINERCVALVRRMAKRAERVGHYETVPLPDDYAEAVAIVALLPVEVDPDLIEARDCVAKVYEDAGRDDLAIATRDGKQDNRLRVQSALAAFRRGRDFGK